MPSTPRDLLSILQSLSGAQDPLTPPSDLKYVIYLRKSTENIDRQARSIQDQLIECQQLADKLGLRVVDEIAERQSAKDSGARMMFRKMLDGAKAGKFGGIIAWHPDRLARNMMEAGEIIDLLD